MGIRLARFFGFKVVFVESDQRSAPWLKEYVWFWLPENQALAAFLAGRNYANGNDRLVCHVGRPLLKTAQTRPLSIRDVLESPALAPVSAEDGYRAGPGSASLERSRIPSAVPTSACIRRSIAQRA